MPLVAGTLLIVTLGLYFTNPTVETLQSFVQEQIDAKLRESQGQAGQAPLEEIGKALGAAMVKGVASLAVDNLARRQNYRLFSIYELNFAGFRELGFEEAENMRLLGIAGQFFRLESARPVSLDPVAPVVSAPLPQASSISSSPDDRAEGLRARLTTLDVVLLEVALPSHVSRSLPEWSSIRGIEGVTWLDSVDSSGSTPDKIFGVGRQWRQDSDLNVGSVEVIAEGDSDGPNLLKVVIRSIDDVPAISSQPGWIADQLDTSCDGAEDAERFRFFKLSRDGYKPVYVLHERSGQDDIASHTFSISPLPDIALSVRQGGACQIL